MSNNPRHWCPAPGCELAIPFGMFACRAHWFALPATLRRDAWRAYRTGDIKRTLEAYAAAELVWSGASS